MGKVVAKFLRILFWCWLPMALGAFAFIVAIGFRGEPTTWQSWNTWAALLYAFALSAAIAILPALLLTLLLTVAWWWRGVGRIIAATRSEL